MRRFWLAALGLVLVMAVVVEGGAGHHTEVEDTWWESIVEFEHVDEPVHGGDSQGSWVLAGTSYWISFSIRDGSSRTMSREPCCLPPYPVCKAYNLADPC
jgi:hypothetical protein